MTRLILSILAAMVVGAVLSLATDHLFHVTNVYPPYGVPMFDTGLLLLASAYRFVFQIVGGYVAAALARDRAKTALWACGIIGTVLWLAGSLGNPELGPLWYGVLGAALSIPSIMIGGKLYELRARQPKQI